MGNYYTEFYSGGESLTASERIIKSDTTYHVPAASPWILYQACVTTTPATGWFIYQHRLGILFAGSTFPVNSVNWRQKPVVGMFSNNQNSIRNNYHIIKAEPSIDFHTHVFFSEAIHNRTKSNQHHNFKMLVVALFCDLRPLQGISQFIPADIWLSLEVDRNS